MKPGHCHESVLLDFPALLGHSVRSNAVETRFCRTEDALGFPLHEFVLKERYMLPQDFTLRLVLVRICSEMRGIRA